MAQRYSLESAIQQQLSQVGTCSLEELAVLDIIHNYRNVQTVGLSPFSPCRLVAGGRVIRSNGESVPLTDPRVKIYYPNFSPYHTGALALASGWLGLHPGAVMPLDRAQLDKGLQPTSGRECLPLPICIGQLPQIHAQRQPEEIAGFHMVQGGAPCVTDAYMGYFERFIAEQRLTDFFLFSPQPENDYLGFGKTVLTQHLSLAVILTDILVEIEHVPRVVGQEGSLDQLRTKWEQFAQGARSLDEFQAPLPSFIEQLAQLPRSKDPRTCPRVVVAGDFFTRLSSFFMDGVRDLYAERGIILKPVDLSELFLYIAYHPMAETAGAWGMKPGGMALAKACTRMFQPDGKEYIQQWMAYQALQYEEEHYRTLFRETGLLVAAPNARSSVFERGAEHVSPAIYGELLPTVGKGLKQPMRDTTGCSSSAPSTVSPTGSQRPSSNRSASSRACPSSPTRATATPSPPRCSGRWTCISSRYSNMRPDTRRRRNKKPPLRLIYSLSQAAHRRHAQDRPAPAPFGSTAAKAPHPQTCTSKISG